MNIIDALRYEDAFYDGFIAHRREGKEMEGKKDKQQNGDESSFVHANMPNSRTTKLQISSLFKVGPHTKEAALKLQALFMGGREAVMR
jgi:hypothetical protein